VRYVVSLVVVLGLAGLIGNSVYKKVSPRHQGRQFLVAFGIPDKDEIQIHLAVPPMVSERDPPKLTEAWVPLWADWVEDHFQLTHSSGERIGLLQIGGSGLIMEKKTQGIEPEFILWAFLKKGEEYAIDFTPILAEPDVYRYEFTAPTEITKVDRVKFHLVTDG